MLLYDFRMHGKSLNLLPIQLFHILSISIFIFVIQGIAFGHGGHAPIVSGMPDSMLPGSQIQKDGAGRLIFLAYDANRDGLIDTWNYYEKGTLVRQERDDDHDGEVDIRLFLKNEKLDHGEMDLDGNGVFELSETYKNDQITRVFHDSNQDGQFDTFHFIENGVHVRTETDSNYNGKVDRWTFFGSGENPRTILEDIDTDGIPDLRTDFDENGSPIKPKTEPPKEEEESIQELAKEGETILKEVTVTEKPFLTAVSDQQIRDRDFANFPRQNPSDLVRLIPGIHVSQHTGGAKAYQYFLRGFDAEHGQDLAAYLDGIPLNEPSQVHGHGYLDLHFLIPETISSIRVIKGPYDPEFGNFATAGAINFKPRRSAEQNTISATAGMYGTARLMGAFGLDKDPYLFVGAVEGDHSDGYTNPGYSDAYRANTGHTFLQGNWSLNLMTNHYGQNSAASDVVPEKWVDDGRINRFGSLDDSDSVVSNLHLIGLTADMDQGANDFRIQAFYNYKRTTIWSNYTFFLLNPERGDQQEMMDNRNVYGINLRYKNASQIGPTLWNTALGAQWRYDQTHQLLANSADRERWNVINDLDFSENALGFWLRENILLTKWLTIVPGARADLILYSGAGTFDERFFNIYTNKADTRQDVKHDWDESAWIVSPKATIIFTPLPPWDIFINYGEGFFSNTSLQMANEPESRIPKVRGGDIGTRAYFWNQRISTSLAGWIADKEQDLVFDPQTGVSTTKDATRRIGADAEFRISPVKWLFLMTDASYVDARFIETNERIPNGPIFLMTNGIGWNHSFGFRGMLRGRYMAARQLDQHDWARPYYVADLVTGYDAKHWGVELALDNLFNTKWEDAVFSYETRPKKNGDTYNGVHWTPGTPFFARFSVTAKF